MDQRPVTNKLSVALVTRRAQGTLFWSRMLVTDATGNPPPAAFCHPLVTWSAAGKVGDIEFLLAQLKINAHGVTAISAMSLLFLALLLARPVRGLHCRMG